jgi:glc operon protein GlcG
VQANVSVAIVDEHGVLLTFERMDGASFISADIAVAKARTAALWRRSTHVWENNVKERPVLMKMPDNLPVRGGLPVMHDGDCIGGVGASGARSDQDEAIVAAGLAAAGLSAPEGI